MKNDDSRLFFGLLLFMVALGLSRCDRRPEAPPHRGDVITQGRRER